MIEEKIIKEIEFDPKITIVDCEKHNCDQWKFHGQATCFLGKCPYEKKENE